MYDDVFGTPSKLACLAPRLEDYAEIFGGYQAATSSSSSFSVLDLDLDEPNKLLRELDYAEVLGGRAAYGSSLEDLVRQWQSSGGDDEPWSPAQNGSMSDEFDGLAESFDSLSLSDDDTHQSLESTTEQFLAFHNKSSQSNSETVLGGKSHVTNFTVVPGYAHSVHSSSCAPRNDRNFSEKHGNSVSKPFLSVLDINLRTKPSRLPPLSRPRPTVVVKKGNSDGLGSVLKPSKNESLCFDVEEYVTLSFDGGESSSGGGAWREEIKYFEVIGEKVHVSKEDHGLKEERQLESTSEQPKILNTRLSDPKVFLEELEVDLSEVVETKVKVSPKRMDTEKRFIIDAELTEQNSCDNKKDELTYGDAFYQVRDEKQEKICLEMEITEERNGDGFIGNIVESFQTKEHNNLTKVDAPEGLRGCAEEIENVESNEPKREVEWGVDSDVAIEKDQFKAFDCGRKLDEAIATSILGKHDNIGTGLLNPGPVNSIYDPVSGVENTSVKGTSNGFGVNKNEYDRGSSHKATNGTSLLPKHIADLNFCAIGLGISHNMADSMSFAFACGHEPEKIVSTDHQGLSRKGTQFISEAAEMKDSLTPYHVMRGSITNRKVECASSVLKDKGDTLCSLNDFVSPKIEKKGYTIKENFDAKDKKIGERIRRDIELENEHIKRLEEEKERERERAKDRMVVNIATLESRERSYAEVHERTEKAAVDRATAELRQRAMAETQQILEKSSIEMKLRDKQASVERATAEACQLTAKKAMAQKIASEGLAGVEIPISDRFPTSFQCADMRQKSLPSNMHSQATEISNSLRYSYSFPRIGVDGESSQRCKARLERYRRTAERAANALAEKNRRDLLAQREREEMHRIAETLDIDVKRWASGKEANLRALLSTLQYILGHDSGWQPVASTEVITCAAVKKAYRKATLCVHPDKLQQRGATIQHKYICEKVFDLLKEAWIKFNSEGR